MFPPDDDPLPCDAYESALALRKEVEQAITALLDRREELPQWAVEALEEIVMEVLR